MAVYRDERNRRWRYRTRVTLVDGRRKRIGGTPAINTKRAAEAAEREHVFREQCPAAAAKRAPKEVPTVRGYLETFLSGHYGEGKPTHAEDVRRMFRTYLLDRVGDRRLDEISQDIVNRIRTELGKTRKTKTVNNIVTPLSTMLRYAYTDGLVERTRVRFTRPTARTEEKIEAVKMADVNSLLKATIDPRYRLGILLAAEAGLRQAEIRALRWEDIADDRATIRRSLDKKNRLGLPKHDVIRGVPLSARIGRELGRMAKRGQYLITRLRDGAAMTYHPMHKRLGELYTAAKVTIPSMPWHCLRHTFGTELARSGVDVTTIMRLMGHNSLKTTLRYLTVRDEQKSAAIRDVFGSASRKDGQHLANTENSKPGKR